MRFGFRRRCAIVRPSKASAYTPRRLPKLSFILPVSTPASSFLRTGLPGGRERMLEAKRANVTQTSLCTTSATRPAPASRRSSIFWRRFPGSGSTMCWSRSTDRRRRSWTAPPWISSGRSIRSASSSRPACAAISRSSSRSAWTTRAASPSSCRPRAGSGSTSRSTSSRRRSGANARCSILIRRASGAIARAHLGFLSDVQALSAGGLRAGLFAGELCRHRWRRRLDRKACATSTSHAPQGARRGRRDVARRRPDRRPSFGPIARDASPTRWRSRPCSSVARPMRFSKRTASRDQGPRRGRRFAPADAAAIRRRRLTCRGPRGGRAFASFSRLEPP